MVASYLGEQAEIVMGQSPPGATCNTSGVGLPLLNGPTEFGFHHPEPVQFTTDARKRAEPGDILFCVRGSTTGRMNWADREYAIGRGVAAIRHKTKPELQPFVRAVVEYGLPSLLAQATGSTFPNVSASQLWRLVWPPIEDAEQHAIAHVLRSLDDKIEANRQIDETLEGITRAIFKSWFVDFDPVRARVEGRRPSGIAADTAALFPDNLVDSELGPMPAGWSLGMLGDLSVNVRLQVDPRDSEEQAYVGLEHVPRRSIALWDWGTSNSLASNKFAFRSGDILFGKLRPYFHKVVVAPVNGLCSTDMLVVRSKSRAWQSFNPMLLSSDEMVAHADATSTGTRMPRTSWADLCRFPLPIPPVEIVAAFDSLVGPMIEEIVLRIFEARTLTELRDALLPRLVSRQVRVEGAERMAESAL